MIKVSWSKDKDLWHQTMMCNRLWKTKAAISNNPKELRENCSKVSKTRWISSWETEEEQPKKELNCRIIAHVAYEALQAISQTTSWIDKLSATSIPTTHLKSSQQNKEEICDQIPLSLQEIHRLHVTFQSKKLLHLVWVFLRKKTVTFCFSS